MPMLTARIELVALDAAIRSALAKGDRRLLDLLQCRRLFLDREIRRAENA